jgi:glycogen debranching enzyme
VHRDEPVFDAEGYWRGSAWPQLTYLLALAGVPVGERLVRGAAGSGLAEHWNPDTAKGLGAAPQSWAGLALAIRRAG